MRLVSMPCTPMIQSAAAGGRRPHSRQCASAQESRRSERPVPARAELRLGGDGDRLDRSRGHRHRGHEQVAACPPARGRVAQRPLQLCARGAVRRDARDHLRARDPAPVRARMRREGRELRRRGVIEQHGRCRPAPPDLTAHARELRPCGPGVRLCRDGAHRRTQRRALARRHMTLELAQQGRQAALPLDAGKGIFERVVEPGNRVGDHERRRLEAAALEVREELVPAPIGRGGHLAQHERGEVALPVDADDDRAHALARALAAHGGNAHRADPEVAVRPSCERAAIVLRPARAGRLRLAQPQERERAGDRLRRDPAGRHALEPVARSERGRRGEADQPGARADDDPFLERPAGATGAEVELDEGAGHHGEREDAQCPGAVGRIAVAEQREDRMRQQRDDDGRPAAEQQRVSAGLTHVIAELVR